MTFKITPNHSFDNLNIYDVTQNCQRLQTDT